jgi:hypothetical protein
VEMAGVLDSFRQVIQASELVIGNIYPANSW